MATALDLPKSVLSDLNRAFQKVLDGQALLDKMERAGHDVSEVRAQLQSWQDSLVAHKKELFPDSR